MIDSLRWQVSTDNGVSWADIYDNAIYSGTTTQQLALIDVPVAYNNYQYRLALKAFCAYTYSNGAVLTVNPLPAITFASDPLTACLRQYYTDSYPYNHERFRYLDAARMDGRCRSSEQLLHSESDIQDTGRRTIYLVL
jgi:hypothetical protein